MKKLLTVSEFSGVEMPENRCFLDVVFASVSHSPAEEGCGIPFNGEMFLKEMTELLEVL